jgi:hypothetical protein
LNKTDVFHVSSTNCFLIGAFTIFFQRKRLKIAWSDKCHFGCQNVSIGFSKATVGNTVLPRKELQTQTQAKKM